MLVRSMQWMLTHSPPQWPAYPDYEPHSDIMITVRTGMCKKKRRPVTKMEFLISLGGFFAQFYEVRHYLSAFQ